MLHLDDELCVGDPLTVEVKRSRLIAAPVSRVWQMLAAFDAIGRWAPNVTHASPASTAREGVGTVRRVQAGRITLLETVTSWSPGERLVYTISGLPPMAGMVTTTWTIAPQSGATFTAVSTVIDPIPGPPGRIISRILGRRLAGAAEAMLTGLADHLAAYPEQT
jgi:uncharacterized protein YndB with AHSA1/START domain